VRVVSLACSNTEIVAALGMGHALVGVDDHSDHPPDGVAGLPRLGPDLDIDVARVAALRPDVVLASLTLPGHERVVERIAALGLPHVAPDPQSLADVYRDIRDIAAILGVPERGEALVARMQAHLTPRRPTRMRILVEWWPKPVIVPGRRSWVTELIAIAGAENPFGARDVRSTPVTDEEVRQAAPDVVVISWCGVPLHRYRRDVVQRRATWADVPAIRADAVIPITEAFLGRPGPRLIDGYDALVEAIDAVRALPPQNG
jgi:iron complex transport system substrate-binding protein